MVSSINRYYSGFTPPPVYDLINTNMNINTNVGASPLASTASYFIVTSKHLFKKNRTVVVTVHYITVL